METFDIFSLTIAAHQPRLDAGVTIDFGSACALRAAALWATAYPLRYRRTDPTVTPRLGQIRDLMTSNAIALLLVVHDQMAIGSVPSRTTHGLLNRAIGTASAITSAPMAVATIPAAIAVMTEVFICPPKHCVEVGVFLGTVIMQTYVGAL